ncbi:MAG: insulinase family protein, partial [Deltaproteobacteria bacterium]
MKALLCTVSLLVACAAGSPKALPQSAQAQAPAASAQPQGTPDSSFRARPPPPGTAVEFRAPIPTQLALKNGLPVFLIERHDIPLVSVALALRSGADTDSPGKAGLSSFALDLLDEGTASRDAAAIAREFEDLGARYSGASEADSSRVSVTALSDTLEPVLEIFA